MSTVVRRCIYILLTYIIGSFLVLDFRYVPYFLPILTQSMLQ